MNTPHSAVRNPQAFGGFTLMELLIVIVIIGILAGLLIPTLMGAKTQARVAASKATIEALRGALEQYQSRFGDYPPTNVLPAVPNDTNVGIESAVACLATTVGGPPLVESFAEERFANTDNDTAGKNVTKWFFGDQQLREIVDDWRNPIIYFHFKDYAKPSKFAKYTIGPGPQACTPQKGSTGAYHNAFKYQVWSAGPDGVNQNGNEDDIVGW